MSCDSGPVPTMKRGPSTRTETPLPAPDPTVSHTGSLPQSARRGGALRATSVRGLRLSVAGRFGGRGVALRCGAVTGGRLRALARPVLVELDAPLAVVALLELQLGAERAAGASAEAAHRLLGPALLDQLLDDRYRQDLAGLLLPDHEAA